MGKNNLPIILLIIFFDQLTKFFAREQIWFSAPVVENPGLPFFGLSLPGFFDIILVTVVLFAFVFLVAALWPRAEQSLGYPLIVGGALSNLADRIFRGSVTDFIDLNLGGVFNLADLVIYLGVLLLLIQAVRRQPG